MNNLTRRLGDILRRLTVAAEIVENVRQYYYKSSCFPCVVALLIYRCK
jgi:hypothetical protein